MTISPTDMPDPAQLDQQIEVQLGRRAPFTQVGDWVLMSCASDRAVTLYSRLSMHINIQRGDTEVWPGQDVLAEMAGLGKPESVTPYTDELVVIGAVSVETVRYANGLRARNRYEIHQTPPHGYVGPVSAAQYYELRRTRPDELAAWQAERRAWIAAGVKQMCTKRKEDAARRKANKSGILGSRPGGVRTPLQRGT